MRARGMLVVACLLGLVATAGAQSLTLDLTFGTNGKVIDPAAGFEEARAVLVQPDGKILVGGTDVFSAPSFGIKRYLSTGAPDPSFVPPGIPIMQGLRGMALQPDGKIVAVGYTGANFGIVRLLPGGSPDPSFDGDGHDSVDFLGDLDWAEAVAIQPDGRIVVSGMARDPTGFLYPAVARFLDVGGLDPMFGTGGKAVGPPTEATHTGPFRSQSAHKVLVDSLGRIVAHAVEYGPVRFLANGLLDTSFGDMGVATLPPSFEMTSIALAPDDGILVIGRLNELVKYTSAGILDAAFGSGGVVTVGSPPAAPDGMAAWSRPDGTFYLLGEINERAVFLGRFLEDGSPDPTFGIDGFVLTAFLEPALPYDLAITSGGEVVVVGRAFITTFDYDSLLMRYDDCSGTTDPAPTVTSITPAEIGPYGGCCVEITGANIDPNAEIRIGGTYGFIVNSQDPPVVEVHVGPSPIGVHDVIVRNPNCLEGTLVDSVLFYPSDVPPSSGYHPFVNKLIRNDITAGCAPIYFCPHHQVTRAQMAVFLLRSKEGASYEPPPATGTVFADVPIDGFAAAWIEELAGRNITAGCDTDLYCPDAFITREQMAVFLLVTFEGTGYLPPDPNGIFLDVPVSSPYARWIEEIFARGITSGCGQGIYCPNDAVLREQMAVFLSITFNLPG